MGLFSRWKRGRQGHPAAGKPEAACPQPYLTETVVFGMHPHRRPGEDSSVYFVDESRGIRKMIVDPWGCFQDFPGILTEDTWLDMVSPDALKPQICFRTSFEQAEHGWLVLWEIQPDGRYWADEYGFGAESDVEVRLSQSFRAAPVQKSPLWRPGRCGNARAGGVGQGCRGQSACAGAAP